MLAAAEALKRPGESIVLFGTPGVSGAAITKTIDRPITFVGEDNVVTHAIIALNQLQGRPIRVRVNRTTARMSRSAGVVVIDPPWYFDFIRPMLATATSACQTGGHMLMSLLQVGTRPRAERDRDRLTAYAQRFGLRPARIDIGTLVYDMPFF